MLRILSSKSCLARSFAGLLAVLAVPAAAQIVFVGPASDPDCDYHTIQEALDDWAASTSPDYLDIFVANSQAWPSSAITIPTPVASAGVGLRGDYPDCHLGGTIGRALIDGAGNGGAPVIDIEGSVAGDGHRFQVNLGSLEITGANRGAGNGGGVRVRGNVVVSAFESDIHDNEAANGGGMSVEATAAGAPQLIVASNAQAMTVRDNHATVDGGGYYCENASIYCDRYCLIEGNSAVRNGGGIAQQACQTAIYPASSQMPNDPHVGLRGNTAGGDGGGAWASGGWFDVAGSAPLHPAPIVGNVAAGSGGGIFLTGIAGSLTYRGVQFDGNQAGGSGGGLSADSGFLMFDAALTGNCAGSIDGCSRFDGNHAGVSGGALALSGTTNLQINSLLLSDNSAAAASVLQLGDSGAFATLINVHVAGNHDAAELMRTSGASLDLRYVTIADNDDEDALIRFDTPATFAASNSILYDDDGTASGVVLDGPAGTSLFMDCVLVHDDSGIGGQPGVTNVIVADPQWDTSGLYPAGVYVPGPDSPAVDACGAGTGTIADLLGGARPQDLPRPDGAGPYDMGAIERKPDVIFADGFEAA